MESGSVMEDIKAASIPVAYYEDIEAKFPESFYAGDEGAVTCYEPTMEELEDPEKLIKHAVAMAVEKDTAFTKVRMPTDWVQKLRRTRGYPYFKPLMLNAVREKIRVFDTDGDAGAYTRETEFYDSYLPREFNFPEEIGNVPKNIRPKKILRNGFDPTLESWLDCNKNFWEAIPTTHNNNVLYAPEVDGSLFPKIFAPFNMNGMIGFLDEAFKSQGHISGIFTNVVYFGQARSSFPWHTEDFELLSANFHHLGAPKIWFGIAPSQRKLAYETFRGLYPLYFDHCPQEPRHKRLFTLPSVLEKAGLNVVKTVQRAGDLIITRSWGYHLVAVNAGYEDLNKALIEKIHKKELYCRCAYNVTGVILDYQIYGVNGHVNSIVKLWEEIANLRTRNAELERIVRGNGASCSNDGLVPSTSTAAMGHQNQSDYHPDNDVYDFGGDDDHYSASSRGQGLLKLLYLNKR
ncbi:putative lysine-specific demethylase 4B-like protein [Aphelenchoides avenae]|nr:putative lysine-specific demethylase 4B-like protein [Aphelenchus avenae]